MFVWVCTTFAWICTAFVYLITGFVIQHLKTGDLHYSYIASYMIVSSFISRGIAITRPRPIMLKSFPIMLLSSAQKFYPLNYAQYYAHKY